MKKLFVVLVALLFAACSNNADQADTKAVATSQGQATSTPAEVYATYTPAQTVGLIARKQNLLIIDVRSPEELREGKLANSILIPFFDIMKGNYNIPKDRPLLLICAVGGRSYAAMEILSRMGYKEIYNLQGGIAAWKQANLPLVY